MDSQTTEQSSLFLEYEPCNYEEIGRLADAYRAAIAAGRDVWEHEYSRLNGGGGRNRAAECTAAIKAKQAAEVALLRAARGEE